MTERRLEGQRFIAGSNNGVYALAHEDYLKRQNAILSALQLERDASREVRSYLSHLRGPIFTFVDEERYQRAPWFTGDRGLATVLFHYIHREGGTVVESGIFAPFSNGAEVGMHGAEAQRTELSYVTTEREFLETFGITVKELMKQAVPAEV